jgi:hypothetical protein
MPAVAALATSGRRAGSEATMGTVGALRFGAVRDVEKDLELCLIGSVRDLGVRKVDVIRMLASIAGNVLSNVLWKVDWTMS